MFRQAPDEEGRTRYNTAVRVGGFTLMLIASCGLATLHWDAQPAFDVLERSRQSGQAANEDWAAFAVAFVASAITAFIAVKWLLSYIQTHRFTAFAIYRLVLGAVLLLLIPPGS